MSVINKFEKRAIIDLYGRSPQDTGSPEVQCAILTKKIQELTEHLKENKKDFQTRRGLISMVTKRKKLLGYLQRVNRDLYLKTCTKLGLRVGKYQ